MLVSIFWGDWHRKMFFDACLPSLDVESVDHDWHIWSDSHPGFECFFHPVKGGHAYKTQTKIIADAVQLARDSGMFLVLIPPDVIWVDGTLEWTAHGLETRASVIINGPRVLPSIMKEYRGRVSGQQLMRLALRHVHPLMDSYEIYSEPGNAWPEMVCIRLPNGFLVRHSAHEVFAWCPKETSVSGGRLNTGTEDICICTDSDDAGFASIAPEGHFPHLGRAMKPGEVARFWKNCKSTANDLLSRTDVLWHSGPIDTKEASRGLDKFMWQARDLYNDGPENRRCGFEVSNIV